MKLVREHINEKFSEESDAIVDMGIGSIGDIKSWLICHKVNPVFNNPDHGSEIISELIEWNKIDYLQFLLSHKILHIRDEDAYDALGNAAYGEKFDVCKTLVKNGISLEQTLNTFRNCGVEKSYRNLLELKRMIDNGL